LLLTGLIALPGTALGGTFLVAPGGSDTTGDGSAAKPWATIGQALKSVPDDGSTILVKDGTYKGQTLIGRSFKKLVTVRAENAYRARLTNPGGVVIACYLPGAGNFKIAGFEITNGSGFACTARQNPLVHLQDVTDVTLEDNIIHDNAVAGGCNELIKVNSGSPNLAPRNIQIAGNLLYNPAPIEGADLIDCVAIEDIDIHDNIFFSTAAQTSSTSFVMIKSQKQFTDGRVVRSPRFRIYRNLFLSWAGAADQAFILLGEDGKPYHEVTDSLIENNLLIGNSSTPTVAAFQLKGVKDITIRANTIVGDLPGGSYALRAGTELDNPSVEGVRLYNNIWSDFTGTMTKRFINTYGKAVVASFVLENNLYHNGPTPLPSNYFTSGTVFPANDPHGVFGDPRTSEDHSAITLPTWDAAKGAFPSGQPTIRKELERLVEAYGAIGAGSAAQDVADPTRMPKDDILGKPRDSKPDIGAYERVAAAANDGPVVTGDQRRWDGAPTTSGDGAKIFDGVTSKVDAATTPGQSGESGCGCSVGARGGVPLLAWLGIALLLGRIRRRPGC
jgi:MYXO-CTERM domain-containing protein